MTYDITMMSLLETMEKFGPLRNQTVILGLHRCLLKITIDCTADAPNSWFQNEIFSASTDFKVRTEQSL